MSFALAYSRAQVGITASLVEIEVHLSNGLPKIAIVGLPEKAVKESSDRVHSALLSSEFTLPPRHITVSLAPADLPKIGSRFDLPIAIGILVASGQLSCPNLEAFELIGELALNGSIRPVTAVFPTAQACAQAQRCLILPRANADEAALIKGLKICIADHISDVYAILSGQKPLEFYRKKNEASPTQFVSDFADVKGQPQAKRALEIAATGCHNVLMSGPPGTGKSLLASRLISILPPLTETEAVEVASLASIRGSADIHQHFFQRPFRQPHHTASQVALIGGGSNPKPGEISLAHRGVLFLDELPEFNRKSLEVLREPLESGEVSISRAKQQVTYPAQFQLIAAMNPCPCGYLGSQKQACYCRPSQLEHYKHKLSGPLLDRIDLHLNVPEVSPATLLSDEVGENSAAIRERVIKATSIQIIRQGCLNAHLSGSRLKAQTNLTPKDQAWFIQAIERMKLSARGMHRVLKLGRTIADMNDSAQLERPHLAEAMAYRER